MKIKEGFKKLYANKNLFIAVCVGILTISVIGVSYSAFFTVQTNTVNQEVTTGTLNVLYSDSYIEANKSFDTNDLQPMSDSDALNNSEARIIHIENKGTLPSEYTLTIGYDLDAYKNKDSELTPIDFVRFAVYEIDTTNENRKTLISGPQNITDLPIYYLDEKDNTKNRYTVLVDTIEAEGTDSIKNYQVKIWLSDKATPAASHTYFYINSEIVATVEGAKQSYDLSGILKDSNGSPISNATIDIQNGSKMVQTNETGNFNISKLPSGTYNVEIKTSDKTYAGNLTIREGESLSVASMASTFSTETNHDIYDYAYINGTTISKIIAKNNLEGITNNLDLSSATYSLASTYLIVSNTNEITDLNISLTGDNGFTIAQ